MSIGLTLSRKYCGCLGAALYMDAGTLTYLKPLAKTLQNLSLNFTKLTDDYLKDLPHFQKLESLSLEGCTHLSTHSMQFVAALSQLRTLCLRGCRDLDLESLSELSRLERLDIPKKTFKDGLPHLRMTQE